MINWQREETKLLWEDTRQNKRTDNTFLYIAIAGIILIAVASVIFYQITGESMHDLAFVSIVIISVLLIIWKVVTRAR